MRNRMIWRSRWAALGAAVAVTLGGSGVFLASAAESAESTVVAIAPVRILDTRADLGLEGPFVSAVGQDLQVTGLIVAKSGPAAATPATVVPAGATGVLLNVTAVQPEAAGFISVRPADAVGAPATSNLNFAAGANVPNAVTVALPTNGPDSGSIEITYDASGASGPTTDVLVDVVGYTVDSGLSDVKADLAATTAKVDALTNSAAAYSSTDGEIVLLFGSDVVVESVSITAPADGVVIVNSSGYVRKTVAGSTIGRCSITESTSFDATYSQIGSMTDNNSIHQLAGTRGFDVLAGQELTVNLACNKGNALGVVMTDPSITAMFSPS